jgi:hypothetical protein
VSAKQSSIAGYDLSTGYKKKEYYPGTYNAGYLLFEVPENLKDSEATFYGTIGSKNISIALDNPIRHKGDRLIIKNVNWDNCTHYVAGNYRCPILIQYKNDAHVPTKNRLTPSVNDHKLNSAWGYTGWLSPLEEVTEEWIMISYNKTIGIPHPGKQVFHGKDGVIFGEAGDKINLSLCSHCIPSSIELTLPEKVHE